jgi:protein-tyrosine-phosphatase
MPSILIVCTANICRSPMAEAILKRLVSIRPDANLWHIESAGIIANFGSSAAPWSQFVMQTMGMDISSHQSQSVSKKLLQNFDVILTMEIWQKEYLRVEYAEIADRVYMLSEMVGTMEDVADPVNGALVDYQETALELERILSRGLDRMSQIASTQYK